MADATDIQMQRYANERIRVRAEQFRALLAAFRDDKAAIDDIYARAADNGNPWEDARTDGPPKLLDSQDVLAFNAFASLFLDIVDGVGGVNGGTAGEDKIFQLHANLNNFLAACVRPVS